MLIQLTTLKIVKTNVKKHGKSKHIKIKIKTVNSRQNVIKYTYIASQNT